ncbi:MAG: Lrp/AsnC family transcriptional regulator [Nitrososphaerota archaeon]|nr:Lrp/AsnC family transcriptional regulator [Nitrososphaerota archaeon]MDG6939979.1 Lrp/AsnC family transcriptional regulator [Nitrososphaerota archaeon]
MSAHPKARQLDEKILKELLRDARLSYRELSRRVKCSVVTVAQRVRRMEEEGTLKGYSALVDQEKLGYVITAITEVTVSKGRLLEVQDQIAKLDSVCAVYDVTGAVDSVVISKFRTRDELSSFTKELLAVPHVERTNTHVVLNTCKEDFRCPAYREQKPR